MSGKFIVIYGPNNIGKSTQIDLLKKRFRSELKSINIKVKFIKYPIYALEPTGVLLNKILRQPESLPRKYEDKELQEIFAQNRRDYQPELKRLLSLNNVVIAEDYTGTGIAWGMTKGVSLSYLEEVNKGLLEPDLAILLDADKRFSDGIEVEHRHESAGEELWRLSRNIHRELAQRYSWRIVKADQTKLNVHEDLWSLLRLVLSIN